MKTECRKPRTEWLDRVGIGISMFCLLQCLLLPLALVFAPLASVGLLSHKAFHVVLLGVIVPISTLAFLLGFLRHRNAGMWWPAGLGLGLLILAAVLEQAHVLSPWPIAMLTSAGGLGLIIGHLVNLRS